MSGGRLYRGLSVNLNRRPVNGSGPQCQGPTGAIICSGNGQHSVRTSSVFDARSAGRDTVRRQNLHTLSFLLSSSSFTSRSSSATASFSSSTSRSPSSLLLSSSYSKKPVSFPKLQQYCLFSDSSKKSQEAGQDSATHCWRCDAPVNGPKIFPDDPIVEDDVPGSGRGGHRQHQHEQQQQQQKSECSTASNDKDTARMLECAHCGALLPLGAGRDHFTLFSLPAVYELDLAELKRRYLGLQQTMHPDRNVNRDQTETGHALDNSSIINAAYKTLRDPYQRALYLLKLLYNIGIDEENVDTEPDMLLEIMELNEDIELASDSSHSMLDMISKIENDLTAILEGIKQAFKDKNAGAVRRLVIRYSYYNSALVKLKEHLNQHQSNQ